MSCVVCGAKRYRVGRVCSMRNDRIVCEECCSKCEHRKGWLCMHRDEKLAIQSKIEKATKRINYLESQAAYQYQRGWTKAGDNTGYKIQDLKRTRKKLMEELEG
jgi:predicted Fe-S protein YdhL (DUF1289 family)